MRESAISHLLLEAFHDHTRKQSRPTTDELIKALQAEFRSIKKMYIVVDGLDECERNAMYGLVPALWSISNKVRLLFTSRPLGEIEKLMKKLMEGYSRLDIIASTADMKGYVHARMQADHRFTSLIDEYQDSLSQEDCGHQGSISQEGVERAVIKNAAGM